MISDRDIRVVEEMCAAGMSKEALYKIFKQFDKSDLDAIHDKYQSEHDDYVKEDINISMNCS